MQFRVSGVACLPRKRDCYGSHHCGGGGTRGARCELHIRPTLGYHQDVVEGMMDASEPFGKVETFINEAAGLDQDEKAALWLFAWSLRDGRVQRREALGMLGALAWLPAAG